VVESVQMLLRGGFMMYPLLASGLIATVVIVDRFLFFKKIKPPVQCLSSGLKYLKNSDTPGLRKSITEAMDPLSSILLTAVDHSHLSVAELEETLKIKAEEWLILLEKRLDILDTIITSAPLMGLLGTITGMMASFQILSQSGVNEPNAITGGVSEALIATATGLVIALISLVAFNYFNSRVNRLLGEMEIASSQVLQIHRLSGKNSK
jgi:biopolymer transport protein ExbB